MTEHDPGDEDAGNGHERSAWRPYECTMCGTGCARAWITPVFMFEYGPMQFDDGSARLLPHEKLDFERLQTCNSDVCKAKARQFANAQRISPSERKVRRAIRSMERARGFFP